MAKHDRYCEGCEAQGRSLNRSGYCAECIAAAVKSGHAEYVGSTALMVEYRCKKCGHTFIDDESETTHYVTLDANDDMVDCGGEGEVMARFPRESIPPNAG